MVSLEGEKWGWEEMMKLGERQSEAEIMQREKSQAVNKACMYIYTSGTTGPPKGISNSNRINLEIS